jgi:hypothetical protein
MCKAAASKCGRGLEVANVVWKRTEGSEYGGQVMSSVKLSEVSKCGIGPEADLVEEWKQHGGGLEKTGSSMCAGGLEKD